MSRTTLVRAGLGILAFVQGVLAVWALVAPRSFYDGFPGAGRSWVSPLGPYDEHLVRDVGALSLALTVVLVVAFVWPDRRLVLVAGLAYVAWSVPHVAFHLTADDVLPAGDRIASEAGELVSVLIAAALVWAAVRAPERPR
jgi:hypothetical protein